MLSRVIRISLTALLAVLFLSFSPSPSSADVNDYHPETGEPKCMNCHTPDRSYSIDYTREESCLECHDPGLSERFIALNTKFSTTETDKKVETKASEKPAKVLPKSKDAPAGMVLIPAGGFTMGSNDWWPKSQPEHNRPLDAFYIDRYEVTNTRYKAFVEAVSYPPPKHWVTGNLPTEKAEHPVVFVNWHDADNFCRWDGKRLPTEPEWEKAARGKDKRTFPWGDKFAREKGNTPQYGNEDTMPVGSFPQGVSPYGIHDLAGNAFEWTADWFLPYPGNRHPDENYGERYKVVRGGSWYDCTYYKCGISSPTYNRIFFNRFTKNNNFGFRCARD